MKALIARDKDGSLSIYFGKKPYKGEYAWSFYDDLSMNFADIPDKNVFPEVTWEDESPTEVSIEIVGKKSQHPQPQTKFDPKTLKPFDKVLVRYSKTEDWNAAYFSHILYDSSEYDLIGCKKSPNFMFYTTGAAVFSYCIPYNDDTKHLVGTTEEAPEYYSYWED